jgi:hypothetical protein
MTYEIPQYGLKAYALFFTKHGLNEEFGQSDLDWIVGQSMKKKIFSLLLRCGWIKKRSRNTYVCISPETAIKALLTLRIPSIIKEAEKPYVFIGSSAIEIWSDYSYVQRSIEKSPYFIEILKKDLNYWKGFFGRHNVQFYIKEGTTIGEYVVLKPIKHLNFAEKDGYKVIPLTDAMCLAKTNEIYSYQYNYIRKKYGLVTN